MFLGRNTNPHQESSRDTVHNYYERMVFEQIGELSEKVGSDGDYMADIACVALNRLPPRYVRYDVDMSFFLSPQEMEEMEAKVKAAIEQAIDYVGSKDKSRGH